jgi:hypothetical protein
MIVGACIHTLGKVEPKAWVSSFIKVNLHPHHQINFTAWCKKIESKLETGECFFKNRVGLFDATPTFWKHMSGEHHHAVVAMIDRFYREAEEDEREATTPLPLQNINNLLGANMH